MDEITEISRFELRVVLRSLGHLPSDRRGLLWRHALQLPLNYSAYSELTARPIHFIAADIKNNYYFLSTSTMNHLMRLSSNLAYWFPFFKYIKYFPSVLLRFTSVYKYCPVSTFEAVATIIENFCQHWFEDFPIAPKNLLNYLEKIIQIKDPILAHHMLSIGSSTSAVCWMHLSTFFLEMFNEKDWYVVWDHILLRQYTFFLMIPVGYLLMFKDTFIRLQTKQDLKRIRKPFKINIRKLIDIADMFVLSEPDDIVFKKFTPLQIQQKQYAKPNITYPDVFVMCEEMDKDDIDDKETKILSDQLKSNKILQLTKLGPYGKATGFNR